MDFESIKKEVKKTLSEKRYYHSECVMEMCEELATIYNVDVEKARKVGIAHDIAKEMENEEKLEYAKLNNIEVDKVEQSKLGLLHAKIGADIAVKKFGFSDDMKRAIEAHTTGKENMDMLAKILYIADWTGYDRQYHDTGYVRNLAKENIDKAIIYTLGEVIKEKCDIKEQIHTDTILTRNDLIRKGEES